MPSLRAFYDGNYRKLVREKRGLALIVISNDLRAGDLSSFMSNYRFPFPVYFDPYSDWNARYGVAGLPVTVVINADGDVVERMFGTQDWQSNRLLRKLETHLGSEARGTSRAPVPEVKR